jgi:hypothetical protein
MAANPQVPFERDSPDNVKGPQSARKTVVPKRPSSGVPGVLLAILVAGVSLAVIGYYMPRATKKTPPLAAAELPQLSEANQLQVSNLQLAPAPTGDSVTLRGRVMNAGRRPVIGAKVVLRFQDGHGQILQTIAAPMIGVAPSNNALVADEFSKNPLKSYDTRSFEVTVSEVPARWNHTMPEMKIVTVSAAGNR